jgi:sorbitol-specific phosphotransferase system component IIA
MAKISPDLGIEKNQKNSKYKVTYVGVKVTMTFEEVGKLWSKMKGLFTKKKS